MLSHLLISFTCTYSHSIYEHCYKGLLILSNLMQILCIPNILFLSNWGETTLQRKVSHEIERRVRRVGVRHTEWNWQQIKWRNSTKEQWGQWSDTHCNNSKFLLNLLNNSAASRQTTHALTHTQSTHTHTVSVPRAQLHLMWGHLFALISFTPL